MPSPYNTSFLVPMGNAHQFGSDSKIVVVAHQAWESSRQASFLCHDDIKICCLYATLFTSLGHHMNPLNLKEFSFEFNYIFLAFS